MAPGREPLVGHQASREGMELTGSSPGGFLLSPGGCWREQLAVLRQVVQGESGGQAVGSRAKHRSDLHATRGLECPCVPTSHHPRARECSGHCQDETPKAPEHAGGAGLGTHALPGPPVPPPRGQGDTHPEGDKAQGTLGTPEAVWGGFLLQAEHVSTLEKAKGAEHSSPGSPSSSWPPSALTTRRD